MYTPCEQENMLEADYPYFIKPLRLDDVPQVMAIERESFPLPWPERAYRYEITQNKTSHYVVLRRATEQHPESRWQPWKRLWTRDNHSSILGYGGFWLIAGEAHISTLAVMPDQRKRGLGELLLWSMLKRATAMAAFEATLEVRVSNHAAQNLYRKYDFERVGRRRRYYQDNGEDAWIMTVSDFDGAAYQTRLTQLGQTLHERLRQQTHK
jgi:ribosomal-protein-alanine N-acetyltransferase